VCYIKLSAVVILICGSFCALFLEYISFLDYYQDENSAIMQNVLEISEGKCARLACGLLTDNLYLVKTALQLLFIKKLKLLSSCNTHAISKFCYFRAWSLSISS